MSEIKQTKNAKLKSSNKRIENTAESAGTVLREAQLVEIANTTYNRYKKNESVQLTWGSKGSILHRQVPTPTTEEQNKTWTNNTW